MNTQNNPEQNGLNRRGFLGTDSALAAGLGAVGLAGAEAKRPPVVMFTKHLQHLNYEEMAAALARMGYDGADIPVRKGGHVLPEQVEIDLPKAVRAVRVVGLDVPMITTDIEDPADPKTEPILRMMAELQIPYYRIGTWHYNPQQDVIAQLHAWGEKMKRLAEWNQKYGVRAGYHNHSGLNYIGGPVFDVYEMLRGVDPEWVGCNFDTGHAVVEGGGGAWRTNFRLLASRIKMSAVKDFIWTKSEKGWRHQFCPMGEGAVDWVEALKLFKAIGFTGPFSIHMEYPTAGQTKEEREANQIKDMERDMRVLRDRMAQAGF
ncbi:MAG: sugar phosphate isomerase/epimerase [bacterium]|jgi:sugar phosphate isomerase/epimerase|nr:sugar phosphate isomerase/epimerase [bacterium]